MLVIYVWGVEGKRHEGEVVGGKGGGGANATHDI